MRLLAPRHEHEALEEVHVLLVLEQGAMEGRDDLMTILAVERLRRDVLRHQ
jgi:hypothetical protein